MKKHFILFLVAGLAAAVNGGTFTNESPAGLKIIWAVPTNVWPPDYKIWTYKVVPQTFSDAVISNAMVIGGFTIEDKLTLNKDIFGFRDRTNDSHGLEIQPALGYMQYYDGHADNYAYETVTVNGEKMTVSLPSTGVPDLPEATRLTLKYARMLGIEVSQLARKPHSDEFDLHWIVKRKSWTDPRTKKEIEETNDLGVCFTRCIDGFAVSQFGDFEVDFGDHAKVSQLIVSWRNLQPYKLNDNFVTPEQVVKSIINGQTPLPRLERPFDQIKTVTITNATPRYNRKPGDQPMDFVVPALQLDAVIDNGKTNRSIWFQAGIFGNSKQ
jgi:hypothetical protein